MARSVTSGSESLKPGKSSWIGVFQSSAPPDAWIVAATPVAESGFESDAIWNTVSAVTTVSVFCSVTPYPAENTVWLPCTTAIAMPGTPELCNAFWAMPGNFAIASSICASRSSGSASTS